MIRRAPYPLPAKRKRVRSGIERAPQRVWPRHRRHVKSHHCCVPGCPSLAVDLAHLRGVNNAGTSLKPPDWHTVPLCRHHHLEQEPLGPDAFGDRHGIDLWAIAAALVRRSPDAKMRLAMLEAELDLPADPKPVIERARVIDLIAGLPRFIPIYAARFPFTDHRTQAEVFAEEAAAAKAKARA